MNQNEWYSVYTAALLELNPAKLPALIHDAETAIFSRIQSLSADPDSIGERKTLQTRCLICAPCKATVHFLAGGHLPGNQQ